MHLSPSGTKVVVIGTRHRVSAIYPDVGFGGRAQRVVIGDVMPVFHEPQASYWGKGPLCGTFIRDDEQTYVRRELAEKVARPCQKCYGTT